MAKRHHSEMHHGMRMHHDKKFSNMYGDAQGNEHYAGIDERRRQEHQDGSMLNEDHMAIANMPQNVIMREYPREGGYIPDVLDDTIRGVDGQMARDNSQKMKHFKPHKY